MYDVHYAYTKDIYIFKTLIYVIKSLCKIIFKIIGCSEPRIHLLILPKSWRRNTAKHLKLLKFVVCDNIRCISLISRVSRFLF
uniref:Uncharacterized protein n=1 Tax=Octopus bimaculoides TaxID=37653 RepID=A0A0L8H3Y1_OCTBM